MFCVFFYIIGRHKYKFLNSSSPSPLLYSLCFFYIIGRHKYKFLNSSSPSPLLYSSIDTIFLQ